MNIQVGELYANAFAQARRLARVLVDVIRHRHKRCPELVGYVSPAALFEYGRVVEKDGEFCPFVVATRKFLGNLRCTDDFPENRDVEDEGMLLECVYALRTFAAALRTVERHEPNAELQKLVGQAAMLASEKSSEFEVRHRELFSQSEETVTAP